MPEGVTKIQQGSDASLCFVLSDYICFDRAAAVHNLLQAFRVAASDRSLVLPKKPKKPLSHIIPYLITSARPVRYSLSGKVLMKETSMKTREG